VEVLNPLSFLLVLIVVTILIGWFFLNRFRSLLLERNDDRSMRLLQQPVDSLRLQLGQVLDHSTQLLQQELSQLLAHVNERLKETAEILHDTQQTLGDRLDHKARVVGSLQKSLNGLEEAKGTNIEERSAKSVGESCQA